MKFEYPIDINIVCPFCGAFHSVTVDFMDYFAWEAGDFAQEAFPYLSPTEREQLISHSCPNCQDKIFKDS